MFLNFAVRTANHFMLKYLEQTIPHNMQKGNIW